VLLTVAVGRVGMALRISAVIRVPVLGYESTAHVTVAWSARVVPRRIIAASKTIPSPPGHTMARLRVLHRVARTIGNVGSSRIRVFVVEAHDVGRRVFGILEGDPESSRLKNTTKAVTPIGQ
jgi:hypothetical protein